MFQFDEHFTVWAFPTVFHLKIFVA
jgi:hypothetical protein